MLSGNNKHFIYKIMKKNLFVFLTLCLGLLVSCKEPDGPNKPDVPNEAPTLDLTIDELTSSSITFTIASETANKFGYRVSLASETAPTVEELMSESFGALDKSIQFTVTDLTPNTEYTVYAVVGYDDLYSEVGSLSVTTHKASEDPDFSLIELIDATYSTFKFRINGEENYFKFIPVEKAMLSELNATPQEWIETMGGIVDQGTNEYEWTDGLEYEGFPMSVAPGREYVIIAGLSDASGNLKDGVYTLQFRTPSIPDSDAEVSINFEEITSTTVSAYVNVDASISTYYVYVRELSWFEDIIANITVRGEIIRLNNQGNLIANILKLTDKTKEVERIIGYCQTELLKMSPSCLTLPNIDYSTSDSDISNFKDTDNNQKIINSSVKNGYTFIYKAYDYDTLALSGYRSTLYTLNKENEANKQKVKELDSKLSVLRRQKKQMNVVVCLVLLLFFGSIVFFNTLDEKNKNIESQQATIEHQSTENSKLTQENKLIHNSQAILQNQYSSLQKEYGVLDEKYDSLLRQFNYLTSSYNTLQSEANERKRTIEYLQSEKSTLEIRCNNYSRTITRKDNDYSTLQKKYNTLSNSYDVLSVKYYSTKEGKKELKNSNR